MNPEFKITKTRCEKALAKTGINLASHSINPYRGCSFGCFYCYSRLNKNVRNRETPWGNFVDVKENILEILQNELLTITPERIILGSVTEPFQEAEKIFSLSCKIIEILKEKKIPLVILSKSALILEALPVLRNYNNLTIYYTINSPLVHKLFENKAPYTEKRVEVLKKLATENFETIAYISPFFPQITELKYLFENLRELNLKVHFEWMNFHIINTSNFFEILEINKENALTDFYNKFFSDKNFRDQTIVAEKEKILELSALYKKNVTIHFDDNDPYFKTINYM